MARGGYSGLDSVAGLFGEPAPTKRKYNQTAPYKAKKERGPKRKYV